MDDKNFLEFLYNDVPANHNIQKYMMVTRNKLREYGRIAVSYSGGSEYEKKNKMKSTSLKSKRVWGFMPKLFP